ncbi:ABC transporter permease [Peterkaempfera bronchialis]|uniref:ABC transporter permease n=1 Tax=Peterkaempfera bronchialis TaxID=2126346 RepID=A0A345T0I6_9ACTN|nr:ABC transporter permease subunit [Peterkaempfera bronchialis]AXI79491.1 ABC transporter permease [Peterkaempfera bronchialis]
MAHPYTSPIPVQQARLSHALASEWIKIRSVRSTVWTLALMTCFIVGIGGLAVLFANGRTRQGDDLLGLGFGGFLIGQLAVIALGVLTISSEYGTGMIRTTLTACPQRARMLTAKALVFFGLVFTLGTVTVGLFTLFALVVLGGQAGSPPPEQILRTVVGGGLYLAVIGLMSLAVGALLRHSAGAIAAMIGFVLLPIILGLFAGETLGRYLIRYSPVSISAAIFGEGLDPRTSGWQLLGVLAVLTAVLLAVAYRVVSRRDV